MEPRRVYMKGTWSVCRVGVGFELCRVQAVTREGAIRAAARKLGVIVLGLDAVMVMPPIFRVEQPAPVPTSN